MQQVDKPLETAPSPSHAPSGAPANAATKPGRKPPVGLIVGLGLALLAGGIYGGKWALHRQAYVSTDDAMVSGNLINVSSRVPGHLAKLLVDEGQEIKAGQIIAVLDEGDFLAQLAQAEAALAVARTGLRTSETGVSLQTTQTSAQILQAQAAVNIAKRQLEHATIKSPVDGVIARRMANVGEQVSTGQGIYSISEVGNLWISAYIEETHIARVKPEAAAEVRIDAYPGKVYRGKVSEIGSVTGSQFSLLPQNNAAGNFTKVVQRLPIKIRLSDATQELKPGMSAVIDIAAPKH